MVDIKEIAKLSGVSISTVSNVLNGRKNVSATTRERILKICKEQNYHPNIMGKNLKAGKTNTIVFNFSDFDRSFYLKIIEGISDQLNDSGYDLIICTHKSAENLMKSNFSSGAISLDVKMSDEFFITLSKRKFPIVLMDRLIDNPFISSVVVDNYPVMYELVQVLVNRGFKKFGYIGGWKNTLDNKERFSGFLDCLTNNNIPFESKYYFDGNYHEESGYQAVIQLLVSGTLPEVLVCANDDMALGAIQALKEKNIKIPEDISITGFDDSNIAEVAGLTTVTIPYYENGSMAAKRIIELIEGKQLEAPYKIRAKIKWRNSVR
ncbi:LacI family DNA-binding transcriptional regulator [Pullulanibacillus sp. KACC 23026]|uniref:LacI family DNA-binding transcriptional regulator n=1 Tax=Pullulanibacillus sp. KACC 23026 TaxID=3028315 RepID=UPI0023B10160|nr:LacI family DNA-binding transcriptional regulator [Pullulanibacillus sp. KACC 23026]WEG12210.1 LacI family DNA-binding transcriptional regulator [Pullulanibacillus sp. KACC 23026]